MKSFPLYITALLAFTANVGWAQNNSINFSAWPTEPWSTTTVELGREVPRTQTICYDSEQAAIEQSHGASAYVQPLGESWQISQDNSATVYSHEFKLPFAWIDRDLFLYVGAANSPYEVFINGERIGYNQSFASAAEFNIRNASKEGINTISIKLHPDAISQTLENTPTGEKPALKDEVYILSQPRVRVRDYTTRITLEGGNAMIELGVILKSNMLNPKILTVHYSLLGPYGEVVTSGRRDREIDMRREDTVRFIVNVPGAKLWSPEDPNLYTLLLKTQNEGRYWEYIAYKVGIRTVEVDNGKLLVNGNSFPFAIVTNFVRKGQPVDIDGASSLIRNWKSQGQNTIITYSPLPGWFYSLCDQMGIFIIPQAGIDTGRSGESRKVDGNPANDPAWEQSYIDRMETMLYTSWNHPSVIGFSLAQGSSNGYNLYESYLAAKQILAEAGDNRPVIYLPAGGEWNTDALASDPASTNPKAVGERFVLGSRTQAGKALTFAIKEPATGAFSVTSNLSFRTVDATISYTVFQGNKRVSKSSVRSTLTPGTETNLDVSYGKAKPGKGPLRVEFSANIPGYGQVQPINVTETIEINF